MNKTELFKKLPIRFVAKIDAPSDEGCWKWQAATNGGYGIYMLDGVLQRAHRITYAIANGPIPPGMQIDHKCFTRSCVNPGHLRAVTNKQNSEHRNGAQSNSASGVRGVYWNPRARLWHVQVRHFGRNHSGGYFRDLADAEKAAVALRAQVFTHANEAVGA